jgi:hypothetical protein
MTKHQTILYAYKQQDRPRELWNREQQIYGPEDNLLEISSLVQVF